MTETPPIDDLETPVPHSRQVDFPCPECSAAMRWDPTIDALSCAYCGHRLDVPREEGVFVERALEDAGSAARGLGVEVRVARCSGCGARVTYDGATTSENCVYCGEPAVLAQEANRNALRPESLVPLDVDRALVQRNFEAWIKGLWFRPNVLKKVNRFDSVGIYVPFWTFDCRVHSDWSADSGTYYYVTRTYTVMVNGKPQQRTRQERRVRWRPAWGDRDDHYDDVLVLASQGLPTDLVDELGDFDTKKLVAYRPEFLAGWRAEEYQVDLGDGWTIGRDVVVRSQRHRCAGDVPGDTHRNLRVKNHIFNVRWKHVLLPVWSLQYCLKEKTYTVLVNGQTGKVVGRAPYSWVKIFFFTLFVLGAIGVILAIAGAGR